MRSDTQSSLIAATAGHAVAGPSRPAQVGRQLRAATKPLGRLGPRTVVVGCALQMLFALAYGISTLATGEPFGVVFGLFLLGFLALGVGGLAWAAALASVPANRLAGAGLAITGGCGLAAIAIGSDPGHDIALVSGYLAWIVVGAGAAQASRPTATVPDIAPSSSRPA